MFDINFIKNTDTAKSDILASCKDISDKDIFEIFEKHRSNVPFIFNIETTNICNMKCIMCPRTKLMKRKLTTMDILLFKNIISQIKTHSDEDKLLFKSYVKNKYGIIENERSENAFYFNISSSYLTLHGYGEPVLDPLIIERIKICSDYKIPTYFSCVPANIKIEQINRLFDNGLGVIKFSLDSLSDTEQKRIRGKNNNFKDAYNKILEVIKLSDDNKYNTKIVITLINLSESKDNKMIHNEFMKLWDNKNVYAYVKSQDNKWLYSEDNTNKVRNHYETGYCEFPWTSLTIMSDGSVVPCTQDYNNEMLLGNAAKNSLKDIWNGEKYEAFHMQHISGKGAINLKCDSRCDIKTIYQRRGLKAE